MQTRTYYSVRKGIHPNLGKRDLGLTLRLFKSSYTDFWDNGYFQEAFGFTCVDAGKIAGKLSSDPEAVFLRKLNKDHLWPVTESCLNYSEDDLFDVIEFLYDWVSKPANRHYHDWNDCGWHFSDYDKQAGQLEFRNEINDLLKDYEEGFELSEQGEILSRVEHGLEFLLQATIPPLDPENVEARVENAIRKFRRTRSSDLDRRDALRELGDVLEFLRPKFKQALNSKDENDLFEILNNFGIRHHNNKQQTKYDKDIWCSLMFYHFLAMIHAGIRQIQRNESRQSLSMAP